jgi:EAL domain-containing protein (putative c-di-GMP-specific phosphodiesterase class I)
MSSSTTARAGRTATTFGASIAAIDEARLAREDAVWLARIRHALAEDLFVLHYQPIVSLADGLVAHHEALLRMADDPRAEVQPPGRFLPAAERGGLIGEIDRMVLEKATGVLSSRHDGAIAINVSALSLADGALLDHIARRLSGLRLDPGRLIVEVTETAAITDMDAARAFCTGVRALGCAIALDDFGAGFGSFQYLKYLPYDYLKIDGGFVRGLPGSRTDQLVVQALVSVARGMGRRSVAEFVGDETTLSMLRAYGVDYAQGFHIGRPGPLAA